MVTPSFPFQRRDWSTKSQMKPPWYLGYFRMRSQYSLKPPSELPIAWAYSHWISGLVFVGSSL